MFPQSVMIWTAMSSAGVGPLCFLKSTVNAAIYQEILEHFMLHALQLLTSFVEMLISFSSRTWHLPTQRWFNDHGVTVLDGPANSPNLNPIENLSIGNPWGIVKREMIDTRLLSKQPGLLLHLSSATGWLPPRRIDAVIHAKGGQPSIECIEINILFRSLTFLFKISFLLILIILIILIFRDTEFWDFHFHDFLIFLRCTYIVKKDFHKSLV